VTWVQPGAGAITSTDGSIEIIAGDLSVAALGAAPEHTTIVRSQADLGTPVAGVITINGRYALTGPIDLGDGVHVEGVDGGIATLNGVSGLEACGLNGNKAGPLIRGSITCVAIFSKNIHASGTDYDLTDTSGRTLHLNQCTSFGTGSGGAGPMAGGIGLADFVQDGNTTGFVVSTSIGAIRILGAFSKATPAGFVNYHFTAASTVIALCSITANTFVTTDASDRGVKLDDAMTVLSGGIQLLANSKTGPGKTLDDSVGSIGPSDLRVISKADSDVPEWHASGESLFQDSVTPIVFSPAAADITSFEVLPVENVGPTSTLALTPAAARFELKFTSPQVWSLRYLGPIDNETMHLRWSITTSKSGSARAYAVKWQRQIGGAGLWIDVDSTAGEFDISTRINTTVEMASSVASTDDEFRVIVASESTDSVSITKILLTPETR